MIALESCCSRQLLVICPDKSKRLVENGSQYVQTLEEWTKGNFCRPHRLAMAAGCDFLITPNLHANCQKRDGSRTKSHQSRHHVASEPQPIRGLS